jgi:hypothetical protein
MTTMTAVNGQATGAALRKGVALPGRVVLLWTLAGGLLLGGFLVAGMTLAGQLSGNALLMTSTALFGVGAAIGFVHGGVLGMLGRPAGMGREYALGALGMGALYTVAAVAVGWFVAGSIALTAIALYLGRAVPLALVAFGWALGLGIVGLAAVTGWRALRNAYARWPERVPGTLLTAAVFGALIVAFLVGRPEVWGLHMRVTEVGAVLLALFITIWVGGPLVTVALRALRALPVPGVRFGITPPRVATTLAIGLAVGLVLGLLALPFHQAPYAVQPAAAGIGPAGGLVVALGAALLDEVLLRLFLVSAVAALLLRWHAVKPLEAAVIAVMVGGVAQVLLYTPGVLAIGFASPLAALGFLLVAVLVPAVAFGALYWVRGFGAAVVAHATALVTVALVI